MGRTIRRRDLWRYPGHRAFLTPVAFAVAFFAIAGWQYADRTAFARRAVVTGGVIERIERSGPAERQDGPPSFRYYARVRYDAGGRVVRARAYLQTCTVCVIRQRAGDATTVAYDPHRSGRVVLAPGGRVPSDSLVVAYFWAQFGLVSLLIGGVIFVLGN